MPGIYKCRALKLLIGVVALSPELVPWLAAMAFLLGFLALVLEIFIIPGFGVAGVIGIIFLGWGILLLSVDVTDTLKAVVIAMVSSIILLAAGIKLMAKINVWRRLTLGDRQVKTSGYQAPMADLQDYVGKKGLAITPLRPSGAVEIGGSRVDVVSEGGYIAAGVRVQVIKVEDVRIIVRAIKE